jgi:hypothetical protein
LSSTLKRDKGREGGEAEGCGGWRLAIDARRPSREVGPRNGRVGESRAGAAGATVVCDRVEQRKEEEGGTDRWDPGVSGCGNKKRRRGGGPLRELGRSAGWAER